jgi:hypothetical protein
MCLNVDLRTHIHTGEIELDRRLFEFNLHVRSFAERAGEPP